MANPSVESVHDATEHLLSVRRLLRGTVLGPERQHLGDVIDIAIRLRGRRYPLVIGVQARVGGSEEFLPDANLSRWHSEAVQLADEPDRRPSPERDGSVLMCSELLGQQLSDLERGRRVRVHDLLLSHSPEGRVLSKIDSRGWVSRSLGWHVQRNGHLDWKAIHSRIGYQQNS